MVKNLNESYYSHLKMQGLSNTKQLINKLMFHRLKSIQLAKDSAKFYP